MEDSPWQDEAALRHIREQWTGAMQRAIEPFDLDLTEDRLDRLWKQGVDPLEFQRALREWSILREIRDLANPA